MILAEVIVTGDGKKLRDESIVNISRPTPLKGTNEAIGLLHVAPQAAVVFVSGLAPNTEPDEIREFLAKHSLDRHELFV